MRARMLAASILLAALLVCANPAAAQETWTKYAGNPVLDKGPPGAWDSVRVWDPSVLFDGSTYKMWYTGTDTGTAPTTRQVGYATSSDGLSWTKHASNPVLQRGGSGDWDEFWAGNPSVLQVGSTYHMYYSGRDAAGTVRIGHATSSDGIFWTKDPANPILTPGPAAWETTWVHCPSILYSASWPSSQRWKMWYIGFDAGYAARIGYATSSDGISWAKYGSNPVLDLGGPGAWDSGSVADPTVLFDGFTYRMWFSGGSGTETLDGIGYATSTNGVTWTKYSGNPVLGPGSLGAWDDTELFGPTVLFRGSRYQMWYAGLGTYMRIGYASSTVPPLAWQAAKRLTNNAGFSAHPSVAVSGNNVYVVWDDDTYGANKEILFKRSTDGGATWGVIQRLTNNAGVSQHPSVATSGSNVYIIWQDDSPGNNEIFFKRSTTNGTGWEAARRLATNAGSSELPTIAASGDSIYVAWMDDTYGGNLEILFKRSTDNGTTWEAVQRLTSNAGQSQLPSIAARDDKVYVAWQDDTYGGNPEILFKRSLDGGATWKAIQRLTSNAGSSVSPSVAASGNNVYVVWNDDTYGGNNEILFKRSTNNGAAWEAIQRLTSNAGSSVSPCITASGSNVYVAWQDNTYGANMEILFKRSLDSGATWDAIQRLTNNAGQSQSPSIAASGNNVYLAWRDNSPGNDEIFFRRGTA